MTIADLWAWMQPPLPPAGRSHQPNGGSDREAVSAGSIAVIVIIGLSAEHVKRHVMDTADGLNYSAG